MDNVNKINVFTTALLYELKLHLVKHGSGSRRSSQH